MSVKLFISGLIVSLNVKMAHAVIYLTDTGTPSSCGSKSAACCIPTCQVLIKGEGCCKQGTVSWSETCGYRLAYPTGQQDVGGCPGYYQTWSKDKNGKVVITVASKNGYDNPIQVTNCSAPTTGGGRCIPDNGGCDTDYSYLRPL